jgi:competence protein ComEA
VRERIAAVGAALGVDAVPLARWAAIGGVVVAAAVGGWLLLGERSQPAELSLPRAGSAAEPTPDTSTAGATGATGAIAHAAGAVGRPGVYRLQAGARVTDLLDAAGGPTPDADLDQLNLAAPVTDGERIYVPRHGELQPLADPRSPPGSVTGPVDLNRATAEQLDALPGIGPATAQAILAYREQHGRFRSVDELLEVRGIGDAKLEQLRPLVKV